MWSQKRRCRKHKIQQIKAGDKIDGIIAMIMALGEMMTMKAKMSRGHPPMNRKE